MPRKRPVPLRSALPDGSRIERNHRTGEGGEPEPYGSWFWVVYDPDRAPKRKRVNLRTKDQGAAMIKAAELAADRGMGTFDPWTQAAPTDGSSVAKAAERFGRYQRAHGRSAATVETDLGTLARFARTLPAGALVRYVERAHVERFVHAPKTKAGPPGRPRVKVGERSRSTKVRLLATLRHFAKWSVERGLCRHDFTAGIALGRPRPSRRDHVTEREEAAILRAIGAAEVETGVSRQWLRDWIVFGAHTGLRPGEQAKLRWSAVRLAERAVEVGRGHAVKTRGSRRTVPTEGPALDVLRRRHAARSTEADGPVFTNPRGGPVRLDYVVKQLARFAGDAGVEKTVVPYSLRHAFGTRAVLGGVPVYHVAQIMGTSVEQIERHYGHFDPARGADQLRRLFGPPAGEGDGAPGDGGPLEAESRHGHGKAAR